MLNLCHDIRNGRNPKTAMAYAMAKIAISDLKRSLKWWSNLTEIPERTLAEWARLCGLGKPYTAEKMIDILSYGYGRAKNAVGGSQDKANINAQKAKKAVETWL